MSRRSRAREVALQLLYEVDLNPHQTETSLRAFLHTRLGNGELIEFSRSLVDGVRRNREELDVLLDRCAENWTLSRMAAIDRNILRLGAYEILFTEMPDAAAIDEAVELAKRFGAKQSPQFVNGILDRTLAERSKS